LSIIAVVRGEDQPDRSAQTDGLNSKGTDGF
jgi:hypothetical protein